MPKGDDAGSGRQPEARLAEAQGLAGAIDLTVVHAEVVRLAKLKPATLFGSGVVARFAELIAAQEIQLVVVNRQLTPVQLFEPAQDQQEMQNA